MNLRNSRASLTLDLMRALAAQAVCIGHTLGTFGLAAWTQPPRVPYVQNIAVLVFFLLSGFLIAHTLSAKSADPGYGFDTYFIDRFARIYSALVPSLIVIALVDLSSMAATGRSEWTLSGRALVGNLLMLENLPGPLGRYQIPAFGTAGQLWTLAIEWHIYVFAGALFFVRRNWLMPLLALASCSVPLYYFGRGTGWGFGDGVSILWALGFAGFYAIPYLARLPRSALACGAIAATVLYSLLVEPAAEYQADTYGILAAAFLFVVTASTKLRPLTSGAASSVIRFLAAYSFTLYLVHNSLVKAIAAMPGVEPHLGAIAAIAGSNLLAMLLALKTEMRHREFAASLGRIRWLRIELMKPAEGPRV